MKYSNIDYANDIKVLGRVVTISVDNKLAEAEQIFDTPFVYDSNADAGSTESTVGLDQYTINRLFRDRLLKLEGAGLIPDNNGKITITAPVEVTGTLTANNGVFTTISTVSENVSGTLTANSISASNITADNATINHTLTANDVVANQKLKGVQLEITGTNNTIAGALTVGGKLTVNDGLDVHGNAKFFDNVTIDGDTNVVNLTVTGTLNAPHATTARYGIVRLATALNSTADDDVVPVSLMRQYYNLILDNPNTQAIDSIKELLDYVNAQGATIPTKLNDLNDVSLSTPASGDVLYYNGTSWVNTSLNTLLQPMANQISSLSSQVTTLTQRVDALEQRVSALEAADDCLWEWNGSYIIPKVSSRNVATSGRFYSGI